MTVCVPPPTDVAAEVPFACPVCGERVQPPGAEDLSFNAGGACPTCQGLGVTYTPGPPAAAGVVASTSRVVTYTITGGT